MQKHKLNYRDLVRLGGNFRRKGDHLRVQTILPVMRLIGWCKNIDCECEHNFRRIFRPSVMTALVQQMYLRPYSAAYGWRLTPAGYAWLSEQGFPMQADRHTQRVNRRFENAAVILTMYAAGIDPFADSLAVLREKGGYLSASVLRGREGQHPIGISLVSGFLRLGGTMFAVHYPQTAQRVIIQREIDCAQSAMLGSGCTEQAYLLCGSSYTDIYRALLEEQTSCTGKRVSYARFYQQISPAYLLPCNKDGVLQLRLMQVANYRPRLAKMLGAPITGAHLSDCDFISADFQFPARIVADMELRQVFRAAQQARAAGYHGLLLAAFESQKRFLSQIFPPPFFHVAVIDEQALCILEMGADL